MTYPMTNNNWMQYFEDVGPNPNPHANRNQYNAGQTARYFLERPDLNPGWQTHSTNLINWIETTFGGTDQGEPGLQYGARVNSEQDAYKFKMASHPSRFAAICAMLAEKTGDLALKEKAFRSLNWCTSMARSTGSVIEGPFEFAANQNNYEFVWRNVPVGTFPISARATNTNSQTATTSSTVTIASPTAPTQVGNTNEGTTTDYITDGSGAYINACRFVASADQQRTIIKAKVNAITGKYQCAIYSDSGGNASALLRASNEVTPAANGTAYWLAIWSNDTTARVHADNGGTLKFAAYPYGTWPNPVNLTGSGSFTYCMYATGPGKTACQQWKQNSCRTPHRPPATTTRTACRFSPNTPSAAIPPRSRPAPPFSQPSTTATSRSPTPRSKQRPTLPSSPRSPATSSTGRAMRPTRTSNGSSSTATRSNSLPPATSCRTRRRRGDSCECGWRIHKLNGPPEF